MSLPTASEKNSENICIYTVYYSGNATFGMFMAWPSGFGGKYNLLEYRTSDCMDSEISEVFVKMKIMKPNYIS